MSTRGRSCWAASPTTPWRPSPATPRGSWSAPPSQPASPGQPGTRRSGPGPTCHTAIACLLQVVNAGKSRTSEDQAVCRQVDLGQGLTYTLFGLFDGHGGNGASMKVAMELPLIIQQHLSEMLPLILEAWDKAKRGMCNGDNLSQMSFDYEQMMSLPHEPSLEELIRGALESAFWVMDSIILNDKMEFRITGGTTCLVSLFICDRIFVANAGDSRAVLYRSDLGPKLDKLKVSYSGSRQISSPSRCHLTSLPSLTDSGCRRSPSTSRSCCATPAAGSRSSPGSSSRSRWMRPTSAAPSSTVTSTCQAGGSRRQPRTM